MFMPSYTVECPRCGRADVVFRTLSEHGRWPWCCSAMMAQVIAAPLAIRHDIAPFEAPVTDCATGKPAQIGSRRELKEFEARNNLVQIGSDVPRARKRVELDSPRPEIIRSFKQTTGRL
jgi:hypothetical protein